MADYTYSKEFSYSHNNPYHKLLGESFDFIYRDTEAEKFSGRWRQEVFKKEAPLCVEIGSGYGHFMIDYCHKNPQINFVGLDYRFKRSFQLAKKLKDHPHKNFRYLRAKGERISYLFAENEVDKIFYFFPDPWPKNRHHKKRLFGEPFLKASHSVLRPGGKLYIKTDHDGYAQWMDQILKGSALFTTTFKTNDLYKDHSDHFLASFKTKFENIFIEQDINIKAFVLTVNKNSN